MAIHKAIDGYLHSLDVLIAKRVFTREQADEQIDKIVNGIIDKRVENENKDIKIEIKEIEK